MKILLPDSRLGPETFADLHVPPGADPSDLLDYLGGAVSSREYAARRDSPPDDVLSLLATVGAVGAAEALAPWRARPRPLSCPVLVAWNAGDPCAAHSERFAAALEAAGFGHDVARGEGGHSFREYRTAGSWSPRSTSATRTGRPRLPPRAPRRIPA